MKKDFLSFEDISVKELEKLLQVALQYKKLRDVKKHPQPLKGKSLALLFEKSSTRTRVSFEVAINELGGHSLYLSAMESQVGRGETYADTARVLSRYVHGIVFRTYAQSRLEELASHATVPVINALSDLHHPVQVLADLLTIYEVKKTLKKIKVAYLGDGNNMANSWIAAALKLGFELRVACPKGFEADALLCAQAQKTTHIHIGSDPIQAVQHCDVINTDTWFSMGQKEDSKKRKLFEPFQVNESLIKRASPQVMVLHCLPAHRGEEITDEVMDGPHSYVFDQAENRLHVQKALLSLLIT
ncbi:MAG: ornithine carbamoyltransferase [Deltaproteobacteria bacterium]|nr:ornithine carbamoyltransferase [Deltaproteobacteria bacterium]